MDEDNEGEKKERSLTAEERQRGKKLHGGEGQYVPLLLNDSYICLIILPALQGQEFRMTPQCEVFEPHPSSSPFLGSYPTHS